jgi:rhamnosyltransferase
MQDSIGVVIRTLNEAQHIGTCLETLARQQPGFDLDVLVVDSGSTDATVRIARSLGARIHEMSPDEFDYSKAINVGLEQVRGELVLILSAHAIPVDETWVAGMIAPFDDPGVAGVASRQLPWDDAPLREVLRLAREFPETGRVYAPGSQGPVLFSNAASCVRRSAWAEQPFTLPAAEDLEWAERVVAAGWSVVYQAEAAVHHSHDESPRAQAQRMIDINRVDDEGRTPIRTVREAAGILYRDTRRILTFEEPLARKLGHLAELLQMVFFYVVDFTRPGTTAERRRHEA